MGINVLSLFDGISCGRVALERAEIEVGNYFASEIDRHAIAISGKNYPDIVQLGNVEDWRNWDIDWDSIDLLIGGSPCQGFSFAGKQLAFDDPRSRLFFVYCDILNHIRSRNPKVKFLLENVRMKKEHLEVISKWLGVEPLPINSELVSAQRRYRVYWSNWEFGLPEDKGIMLKDILIGEFDPALIRPKSKCVRSGGRGSNDRHEWDKVSNDPSMYDRRLSVEECERLQTLDPGYTLVMEKLRHTEKAIAYMDRKTRDGRTHWDFAHHSDSRDPKSVCVTANFRKGVPYNVLVDGNTVRKFHPVEIERLQTLPDNFSLVEEKGKQTVSDTQRYFALGNSWTVDVIAHIFRSMQ